MPFSFSFPHYHTLWNRRRRTGQAEIVVKKTNDPPRRHSPVGTSKVSQQEAQSILEQQRLKRPVSPHLSAYRYDQTWFGSSIWTRITGGGLSGAVYVYFAAYLVSPLMGWHIESASLAASFAALPVAAKGAIKFLVAWPFAFHCVNGIRHLSYDLTFGFARKQIVKWGWVVWGSSLALGLYAGFAL